MTGIRKFFTVIGILLLLGGLFFTALTLGVFQWGSFLGYNLDHLVRNYSYTVFGFLISLVGILLIALFAFKRNNAQGDGAKKEGDSIVSYTEIGEVHTSFKAVENMVLAASRKVNGISEVTTRIDSTEQGLLIHIKLKAMPDIPIPGLAGELQEKVRNYVQEISGSNVSEIKVLVEDIVHDKFQRTPIKGVR